MHKSRLRAIGIDCQTDNLTQAVAFWSRALSREPQIEKDVATDAYVTLGTGTEDLITFVQRVEHPSRVHLDIETDDVEAEVVRLEALGARRVQKIKTWWVLEAPSGQRFCVVRLQQDPPVGAWNRWP